jgi:hypothetical protein
MKKWTERTFPFIQSQAKWQTVTVTEYQIVYHVRSFRNPTRTWISYNQNLLYIVQIIHTGEQKKVVGRTCPLHISAWETTEAYPRWKENTSVAYIQFFDVRAAYPLHAGNKTTRHKYYSHRAALTHTEIELFVVFKSCIQIVCVTVIHADCFR